MNEGHIFIDGEIDAKMYAYVKTQLMANANAQKLIIHLNSPGGSVNLGYSIYHKLKSLPIPKECVIEGNCMSIATFIALACNKITALNPSRYMIHLPSLGLEGTRSDLENGVRELAQIEQEMIAAYQRKTSIPAEQLMAMMSKETYMSADEARQYGFVDEVKTELNAYALGKMSKEKRSIFNSFKEQLDKMEAMLFGTPEVPAQPANVSVQTDKGTLTIDSADGSIEGKNATIGGAPAPDGDYVAEDGKTITISGGMVSSVNEGTQPPPPQESAEDKLKKMEADFNAMKAENEQLKASQVAAAETQQKLVAVESELGTIKATATQTREAFAQLKTSYEDLRKKTIGDDAPPAGPTNHKKNPASETEDIGMIETKDFLKEFAPHLLNLKK